MHFLKLHNAFIGHQSPLILDANAELSLGEVCLLMGNNGIGKTTLIKTILGQINLLSGQIFINNQPIKKLSSKAISDYVAIVFSKSEIPNNYTVRDLISLGKYNQYPYYFRLNSVDYDEIGSIIKKLNLSEFEHRKLTELSDGNLQKAFIGRALAQNSLFIILDEPTTHLDEENKLMILSTLREISKSENKLILFSSHDWRLSKEFADKIWWIKDKQLINGISEDVIISHPELSQPKILNFNKSFVAPEIIAPSLEKELLYSYLQKNLFIDLKNVKISYEMGIWHIEKDNLKYKCRDFTSFKQILETPIKKDKSN